MCVDFMRRGPACVENLDRWGTVGLPWSEAASVGGRDGTAVRLHEMSESPFSCGGNGGGAGGEAICGMNGQRRARAAETETFEEETCTEARKTAGRGGVGLESPRADDGGLSFPETLSPGRPRDRDDMAGGSGLTRASEASASRSCEKTSPRPGKHAASIRGRRRGADRRNSGSPPFAPASHRAAARSEREAFRLPHEVQAHAPRELASRPETRRA